MKIKTIFGLHGDEFHKRGLYEVQKLPQHLLRFVMWGTPEEHDIALKVIRDKKLITEAGEEEIADSRDFLRMNPMSKEEEEYAKTIKDEYREQFNSLTVEEGKEMDRLGKLFRPSSPDASGEKTTV